MCEKGLNAQDSREPPGITSIPHLVGFAVRGDTPVKEGKWTARALNVDAAFVPEKCYCARYPLLGCVQ